MADPKGAPFPAAMPNQRNLMSWATQIHRYMRDALIPVYDPDNGLLLVNSSTGTRYRLVLDSDDNIGLEEV